MMPNFDSFAGSIGNAASSVGSIASQAVGVVGSVAGTAARMSGAINNVTSAAASISALRSINLPPGGNPIARVAAGAALFSGAINQATGAVGRIAGAFGALGGGGGGGGDWRARITGFGGEKLIFPYTPTIAINGGANYEEVPITHQNYSFFAYQNSKAETISITAPWFNEDAVQGMAWVKAVNFLRKSVKMFPDGNPPFICKFDAYGDHVFNAIPVIIKTFSVDLPSSVDYIAAGTDHVPIKSNFSIQLQPVYSREEVKGFSLSSIHNGKWV